MVYKAPGKAHRKGLTLVQMMDMFPTEDAAVAWFESVLWPNERCCGNCGSTRTREVPTADPTFRFERAHRSLGRMFRCVNGPLPFICALPASRAFRA